MKKKVGPLTAAVILTVAGCGGSKGGKPAEESAATAASTPAPSSADTTHPSDPCPRTGLWAQCSVEKRLSQSGFVVRRVPDSVRRRSGFSVLPIPYILGRSRLDVFVYPTPDAAAREASGLDTVLAGPRGVRNQWGIGVQPTFVRSANLIAVFLTDNPTQSERLSLALTAGPPQP